MNNSFSLHGFSFFELVSVGATAVGMSTGGTTVGVEASSLHASTSSRAQNDSSTLVENQSSTVNLVVTDNVLSSSAEDYLVGHVSAPIVPQRLFSFIYTSLCQSLLFAS